MDSPHFFPDTLSPEPNACPGTQLTRFTFPVALALGCLLVVLGLAAMCLLKRRQVSVTSHGHCLRKPAAREQGREKRGYMSPPSGSLGDSRTKVGEEPQSWSRQEP